MSEMAIPQVDALAGSAGKSRQDASLLSG